MTLQAPILDGPLLNGLFPSGVITAEVRGGGSSLDLRPDEADLVSRAVPKRRAEFAAGRACAHAALDRLGMPSAPIRRSIGGAPTWPVGIVGSISHSIDIAGAAVARDHVFAAVGLDIELIGAVGPELWPSILTARELQFIRHAPSDRKAEISTLAFSAKEAVYKAQYPVTEAWLDFHDLEISTDNGGFRATLTRDVAGHPAGHVFSGRYGCHRGMLAAGVAIRARL